MENRLEKLYDLKELQTISAGDNVFFKQMISLFVSQNEAALLEIRQHADKRDFDMIKAVLHKMKPAIMVMGVSSATDIITQIEHSETASMEKPEFSILLLKLGKILQDVNGQLRLI